MSMGLEYYSRTYGGHMGTAYYCKISDTWHFAGTGSKRVTKSCELRTHGGDPSLLNEPKLVPINESEVPANILKQFEEIAIKELLT